MSTPADTTDSTIARLLEGGANDISKQLTIDVTAPTDDRPYFFDIVKATHLFDSKSGMGLLASLLLLVLALSVATIIYPLTSKMKFARFKSSADLTLYFAAIGLAFMLVEISQLQRFALILGHPVYSLTTILFTIMLFSGLGSFATQKFQWNRPAVLFAVVVMLAACGGITDFVAPLLGRVSSHIEVRILASVLMLAPLGFVMGMPMPLGLKLAAREEERLTPWLWAINGSTSVVGSVVAVMLSLSFGIRACFWIGLLCYLPAAVAYLSRFRRLGAPIRLPDTAAGGGGSPGLQPD